MAKLIGTTQPQAHKSMVPRAKPFCNEPDHWLPCYFPPRVRPSWNTFTLNYVKVTLMAKTFIFISCNFL